MTALTRSLATSLFALAACNFQPGTGSAAQGDGAIVTDGTPPAGSDATVTHDGAAADAHTPIDAARDAFVPPPTLAYPHIPSNSRAAGSGDWPISTDTMIDTGSPNHELFPTGVTFETVAQTSGGSAPNILIIHAATVEIAAGKTLSFTGAIPAVIIANTVTVDGTIDAGGKGATPGAGGDITHSGAGGDGAGQSNGGDGGGGGGGFGGAGAAGGTSGSAGDAGGCSQIALGGTAGASEGDGPITVLVGGDNGGTGSKGSCTSGTPGGGGGGALQISASQIAIALGGAITAGGGGGTEGVSCSGAGPAGGGGGAGGAVVLDALTLSNAGTIAANGGGGGGGGCGNSTGDTAGADGSASDSAASGGSGVNNTCGNPGGAGGFASTPPVAGTPAPCTFNAGGGGGGVGRIAVYLPPGVTISNTGVITPAAAPVSQ